MEKRIITQREGVMVQTVWNSPEKSKFHSQRNYELIRSGNACYHSVQNLLSSSLLPKDIKNCNFAFCFVHV
jgi:hypothetical protein